jgi:hypothetical protein
MNFIELERTLVRIEAQPIIDQFNFNILEKNYSVIFFYNSILYIYA